LVPALRYDYFSDYEGRFSPKIGGVFNFGTSWKTTLKWNTGLSYRAPNFNELYWPSDPWTVGNPDLKAEHGFDWDLGIRLRYPIFNGIALDLTYFDVRMKDLILWQSLGQIWMPLNVDKVRNKGLEVNFNVNPMWSVLSLSLNYTLLDARNLTEERNTKNKILVYRPRHTLNLGFTLEWRQFRFAYDFSYVSRRYTTAANTAYLDPYQTSDLVFAFQQPIGSWKSTFTFQIKNVFDEKYEIIQYQPIPGREYRANIGIFFN
jgi:outer membrane cobalamin receptor